MVYFDVRSTAKPEEAEIRQTTQGERIVYLRRDIVETRDDDSGKDYGYDEAVFTLPSDRDDTLEQIKAAADDWWLYASQAETTPSVRERLADLEDAVLMLSEIIMGGE